MTWLAGSSSADATAFLGRLLRMDPGAVVRLRPVGDGTVALWSRLPFGVLVSRSVQADVPADRTVAGRELLDALDGELPISRDGDWRWSLPPLPGRVVERIPVDAVRRLDLAAAATVRTASAEGVGGRAVGSRVLRDALLDHVPIVVTSEDGIKVDISQRLVQAVVRMGFTGADFVDVRISASWTALACAYGSAWHRAAASLLIR